ncbi:MAG: ABC transporter permease [Burkholderiaceae bacterium]|nr:ABC transporter permease [Burkholderiaceae bacterium]
MWRQLPRLSIAEWRHHPWRHGVALLAVALGVALASSVQMINESALAEFSQAVRSVNGQPDAVLASIAREGFADALYARLALDEAVALASPVLEIDSLGRRHPAGGDGGPRVALRIVGVDGLKVAAIAPGLLPRLDRSATAGRSGLFDPDAAFLNPTALAALGLKPGDSLALQAAGGWQTLRVAGTVAAGGAPLVVIDIATAQARFGRAGRLSRVDLRLLPGVDAAAWQRRIAATLPPGVRWAAANDAVQRVSNLSRAYRVNLGVLALVALLVGGFLVYSVVSLSVAQRTPALALLGVLGLAARDRRLLVLAESAVVGAAGSAAGLAAGAALAALALRLLGGDLGGGYFGGAAPALTWPVVSLAACFVLGTAAAVAGAWFPARQAEALSPAMALKGLGGVNSGRAPVWPGLALLGLGAVLALLPAIGGLALAAYAAVGALLAGGVVLVPALVQLLLSRTGHPHQPVALLALRRARFARQTASATVAGVVASLALSVAITVMVSSFRSAVADWLDQALPADLYARSSGSSAAADQAFLPSGFVAEVARLPGVARVVATRQVPLVLRPEQPAVVLLTRPLGDDPAAVLPLLGAAMPAAAGDLGVFVSEPAAAIHGWRVGDRIRLPIPGAAGAGPDGVPARVRGVWRDYARQFGAIAVDAADYRRLTGDSRSNDLALWLAPGAAAAEVEAALKRAAGPDLPLDVASTTTLRRLSLTIFDRSFAVTVYLQAVAIAVGLVGVAASLSAQVLARRKEFGLLAHLGLTRRQIVALVGAEAAAWLVAGTLIGLALGLAMAVVLVHVVNPQSFHWTMPLQIPGPRLAALAGAVLAAGIATALWSARRAAGRSAVMAVKEDW